MRDWPWYGYVLIAIIIFGIFFLFHFRPKNEELKELRVERIKVEKDVVRLREKKDQLDIIEEELKLMSTTLNELEAIMPQKEEIDVILRQIQQLANDTRLNITKFVPKAEIAKDFYAEKPISIEITGNYHNLGIFFDRLSNFSLLFNIEDFSITSLRVQSEASTISAKLTAKTYISPEAQPGQEESGKNTGEEKK